MTHAVRELDDITLDVFQQVSSGHAGLAHLLDEYAREYSIGIVIVRPEIVQSSLTGAGGIHDHLPGRGRYGYQSAPADRAAGSLEWVAAAGVNNCQGKTRLLLGQGVENPVQGATLIRDLCFVIG